MSARPEPRYMSEEQIHDELRGRPVVGADPDVARTYALAAELDSRRRRPETAALARPRPEPQHMSVEQICDELLRTPFDDLLADSPRVRALADELASRRPKNVAALVAALADLTGSYIELRRMYPGDDEILLPLKKAIVAAAEKIS